MDLLYVPFEVSRSGYYSQPARERRPGVRPQRHATLIALIEEEFVPGRGTYGAPREQHSN